MSICFMVSTQQEHSMSGSTSQHTEWPSTEQIEQVILWFPFSPSTPAQSWTLTLRTRRTASRVGSLFDSSTTTGEVPVAAGQTFASIQRTDRSVLVVLQVSLLIFHLCATVGALTPATDDGTSDVPATGFAPDYSTNRRHHLS